MWYDVMCDSHISHDHITQEKNVEGSGIDDVRS